MGIGESVKSAIKELKSNKGRTFLTMLGMFIGVSAVIMILALGNGFREQMSAQFSDLGMGTFQVQAKGSQREDLINREDIELIASFPEIDYIEGAVIFEGKVTNTKGEEFNQYIFGVQPIILTDIQHLELKVGRFINDKDVEISAKVAMVPDVLVRAIFKTKDYNRAIGESIRFTVKGKPDSFQIVGVYKTSFQETATQDELEKALDNYEIYAPLTTVNEMADYNNLVDVALGVVKEGYDQGDVAGRVRQLLNKRHHLKDGYQVMTAMQLVEMVEGIMDVVTLFISSVASISLIVGGVGIMNIMLVTVKERTREIGVRKALGASNKVILKQFLIEALMLTIIAGLIGMLIGYVGAILIGSAFDIEAQFTLGMLLFATLTSITIGIVFGVYPAYQAAQLDPIEALRCE